jgi:hypothetical protein
VRISSGPTDYVYTPQQIRQMIGGTYDPATILATNVNNNTTNGSAAAPLTLTVNNDVLRGGGAVAIVEYLYRSYGHLYVRSTIGNEQQKVGPRKPLPLALRMSLLSSLSLSYQRSAHTYHT